MSLFCTAPYVVFHLTVAVNAICQVSLELQLIKAGMCKLESVGNLLSIRPTERALGCSALGGIGAGCPVN